MLMLKTTSWTFIYMMFRTLSDFDFYVDCASSFYYDKLSCSPRKSSDLRKYNYPRFQLSVTAQAVRFFKRSKNRRACVQPLTRNRGISWGPQIGRSPYDSDRRAKACARTSTPVLICSGEEYSSGRWETPPRQGIKIIPIGEIRAIKSESW